MKTLIVLSSPAGAGKSTWSNRYKQTHPHVEIISSDDTHDTLLSQSEIYRKMDVKTLYKHVWSHVEDKVRQHAKEGNTTIVDATSIYNNRRTHYVDAHPEYDHFVLVLLIKSPKTILHQNQLRNVERIVPEDRVIEMIREFEMPNEEVFEKFDEIIEVTETEEKYLKRSN